MSPRNVKLILLREIRDQLRDRRTLFMIFVLPLLLYPLLGMSLFQVVQFRRTQQTSVLVVGLPRLDAAPDLIRNGGFNPALFPKDESDSGSNAVLLVAKEAPPGEKAADPRAEARREVQSGRYDVALCFPADFAASARAFRAAVLHGARRQAEDLEKNNFTVSRGVAKGSKGDSPIFVGRKSGQSPEATPRIPSPEIIYTTANERSQNGCNRLVAVLERWREELGKSNLAAGGVPDSAARPFSLEKKDIAEETPFREAAIWSKILPVMLLILAMTGAFYPAVDLCAGEKERGTLETLLSSPAERSEIVLGKLLTVMIFSMATAVLNLVSMGFAGWLIFGHAPKFGPPPPLAPLWLAIALVPISALYSALCLALAALARSTREGQYYLVPLLLVTMPLAVLPMAPGVELTLGNSLIPVTGVVLLLRSMIEGSYWQALQYLPVVLGVTLAACVLAVRWAVDQFNSETVLFRESEQLDVGLWLRRLLHDRQPTPTAAAALLCGILILMIHFFLSGFAGKIDDFAHFARLTLVLQLAGVATPALLMAIMLTSSPRQTLLLRMPRWTTIPAVVVLVVALHPVVHALQAAVERLYPMAPDVQDKLQEIVRMLNSAPLWQVLLLIALVPAVCEELAFRGFILSGFRRLGYRWRAIAFSAIFFGVVHGILQQQLLACAVGVVLGLLAVQTRSLLPGVLFHLVHNSLPLVLPRCGPARLVDQDTGILYSWPAVVVGGLVAAAILVWFLRIRSPKSPEEELQAAIQRGSHNLAPEP